MIDADALAPLVADYLVRQRWFAGEELEKVHVRSLDVVRDGDPALLWTLVDVDVPGEPEPASYQVVIGARPATDPLPEFLHGKERVILGEHDGFVLYDALVDTELAIEVLQVVAPDEEVDVARPLVVEQSNSSVIYDERLIMKLFRRIHDGGNPDVEVNRVLHEHGFEHVVPQVANLRRDGADLAVVRKFFVGALDAWHLAHTSLRDALASRMPPEECGGDFAADAFRIGEVTARLHLAMAEAFGVEQPDVNGWIERFVAQVDRIDPSLAGKGVTALYGRVSNLNDAGASIRVHGDLHLGQLVQADARWYVLDFEGEPARPVEERTEPSSPAKDVAGMLRSFHYAARTAIAEWGVDVDAELSQLSDAWEQRAVDSFLDGYRSIDGIDELLPANPADLDTLLAAFEIDKAVYEVGYELAHRPDWVVIPLVAIERILSRES